MDNSNKIKQLFGYNFYFVHGTHGLNLFSILKDGLIKISTEVPDNNDEYQKSFGGNNYAHGLIVFDKIKVDREGLGYPNGILINPEILLYENVIFNSKWLSYPIPNQNIKKGDFSLYLNKNDTKDERIKKIKIIKKTIKAKYEGKDPVTYFTTHEFLFPNGINLKYMIGIFIDPLSGCMKELSSKDDKKRCITYLKHIIKKKFNGVKVTYPKMKTLDDKIFLPKLSNLSEI